MRLPVFVLCVCFLCVSCAQPSTRAVGKDAPEVVRSPGGYFEFHIDPWMSLHHQLYHAARQENAALSQQIAARIHYDGLSKDETAQWMRAVAGYAVLADKDLLFDAELTQIKGQIARGEESFPKTQAFDALRVAMPVYAEHWWPAQRAQIRQVQQLLLRVLQAHEADMATALSRVLDAPWGVVPQRVDLTYYASWAPAYTTNQPNHIVFATDVLKTPDLALEMLFHEAAHTWPLGSSLKPAVDTALERAAVRAPRFWHMVQFFAVGYAAAEVQGDGRYVMYADHERLWRGRYGPLERAAIELHWGAYARGEGGSLEDVVRRIAEALAVGLKSANAQ